MFAKLYGLMAPLIFILYCNIRHENVRNNQVLAIQPSVQSRGITDISAHNSYNNQRLELRKRTGLTILLADDSVGSFQNRNSPEL